MEVNPYVIQIEHTCKALRLFSGLLGSLEEMETDEYQRVSDRRKDEVWNRRLNECRRTCAGSMEYMADVLSSSALEAGRNLIQDNKTGKVLGRMLKKMGIQLESIQIRLLAHDRISLELFLKCVRGDGIPTRELGIFLSRELGRQMISDSDNPPGIGSTLQRFCYYEKPRFHTTYGIARIGKDCDTATGDNFSFLNLKNGWQMAAVSDGMGSGETAAKESERVIDMLEEFLQIGMKPEDAVNLINTAIVLGRNRVCFSTLDIHTWNVYTGECQSIKAGASMTFLKRGNEIRRLYSDTLPVGVITDLKIAVEKMQLQDGDFLIMITDGILDALPVAEQDFLLDGIIRGGRTGNPSELAHHILRQVLEWRGGEPQDDMLVMVTGIWEEPDKVI